MEICYPAILLFILAIFLAIRLGKNLWWGAGIVFGSVPLLFAYISYILCKKGHKKMAWIAPLFAVTFTGLIIAGV